MSSPTAPHTPVASTSGSRGKCVATPAPTTGVLTALSLTRGPLTAPLPPLPTPGPSSAAPPPPHTPGPSTAPPAPLPTPGPSTAPPPSPTPGPSTAPPPAPPTPEPLTAHPPTLTPPALESTVGGEGLPAPAPPLSIASTSGAEQTNTPVPSAMSARDEAPTPAMASTSTVECVSTHIVPATGVEVVTCPPPLTLPVASTLGVEGRGASSTNVSVSLTSVWLLTQVLKENSPMIALLCRCLTRSLCCSK